MDVSQNFMLHVLNMFPPSLLQSACTLTPRVFLACVCAFGELQGHWALGPDRQTCRQHETGQLWKLVAIPLWVLAKTVSDRQDVVG